MYMGEYYKNENQEYYNKCIKNYDKIKIKQVLGNCGKLFYFDNNIGHRAGPKINKERTAVILQLYPSLHKVY